MTFMKRFYTVLLLPGFFLLFTTISDASSDKSKEPTYSPRAEKKETDRVLVKFKPTVGQAKKNEVLARHGAKQISRIEALGLDVFKVSSDHTAREVADRLKALEKDKIEYVEVDEIVDPTYTPSDPLYFNQWHHPVIGSSQAWDSVSGQDILIAIADTGVDPTHPDLAAHLVAGRNVVSGNSDTAPVNGHGTNTAGTAAAIGDNQTQVAGVAYNASIMPIKVSNLGSGSAYTSDIANGIIWAADHGAKVVNVSYGVGCSATAQNAGAYMKSKGGLTTVSAGNDGTQAVCANSADLIVVSATNSADMKTSWSTYGNFVDVAAPGEAILTTAMGGGTASVSGTSFSAPMTEGVVALIWSVKPTFTPDQVENILYASSRELGDPGKDALYGWGRIDAGAAVALAQSVSQDAAAPSVPTNLNATALDGSRVALTWFPSSDNVRVAGYKVFRNGSEIGMTIDTQYTDTALISGASYSYAVASFDLAGNNSALSAAVNVTMPLFLEITGNFVSNKTATSAKINWTTNFASTGYVKYGTSSSALNKTSLTTQTGTSHSVTLSGLSRRTTYYYRIFADSTNAGSASTSVSNFKTLTK